MLESERGVRGTQTSCLTKTLCRCAMGTGEKDKEREVRLQRGGNSCGPRRRNPGFRKGVLHENGGLVRKLLCPHGRRKVERVFKPVGKTSRHSDGKLFAEVMRCCEFSWNSGRRFENGSESGVSSFMDSFSIFPEATIFHPEPVEDGISFVRHANTGSQKRQCSCPLPY